MSLWSDYEHDYDPFDRDEDCGGGPGGMSQLSKTCTKCGHSPLVWNEVRPGVFRLYDPQLGKLHTCPPALDFK